MTYVLAVSGGVDSMVLLDMMVRAGGHQLIVAHFDHGIRPDSHEDALLVEATAKQYGLTFEKETEQLGPHASEALARERRYAFLHRITDKYHATLVTAHHLDDVVETVAINVYRGTGWRGLAVLDANVLRPLVDIEKATLLDYAKRQGLVWREDSTNASDVYLRNRIRQQTTPLSTDAKRELRALHARQREIKREIQQEIRQLIGDGPLYSRYFFTHVQPEVATECLREITRGMLTRPQLTRALHAIKVAHAHTVYEAGGSIKLYFSTRQFRL